MIAPINRSLHIPSSAPHPSQCRGQHTEKKGNSCFHWSLHEHDQQSITKPHREHSWANKIIPTSLLCPKQSWLMKQQFSQFLFCSLDKSSRVRKGRNHVLGRTAPACPSEQKGVLLMFLKHYSVLTPQTPLQVGRGIGLAYMTCSKVTGSAFGRC